MGIRVLCTGDIHIGRRASKVADVYRSADAWGAIVDLAIAQQVDLLAISGDVIDKENKAYEAIGALQRGLERLDAAGIDTVAVTGNHDHDVLARVGDMTGATRFHLLGRGGRWERFTLRRDDVPLLHIDGWSFPSEHVADSPLRSYGTHPDDGVPVLGLVHGDIGASLSRYAPIHLQELWAPRIDLWLLGHLHQRQRFVDGDVVRAIYPGSPMAMDPGEPGAHGVAIASFDPTGEVTLESVSLSPVRYEEVPVDLGGVADAGGFQRLITGELNRIGRLALAEDTGNALKVVSARLICTGQSDAHRQVPSWALQAQEGMSPFPVDSIVIEIDRITVNVQPRIDLDAISQGREPTAETARLILALRQKELQEPYAGLVQRTLSDMLSVYELPGYARLRGADDGPTEGDARTMLEQQAWILLSSLLAQKGSVA